MHTFPEMTSAYAHPFSAYYAPKGITPPAERSGKKATHLLHPNSNGLASAYNSTGSGRERSLSNDSARGIGNQRKMTNTVRSSNRAAILAVGEELRLLLHEEEPPVIKDRRYHLKVYQDCVVGHEMVDWLLGKGEVETRREAVAMMQKLLDNGVIHHVCDDHIYKDEKLFYRFRKDDGTYEEPPDAAVLAKGQRLYSRMRGDGSTLIHDRKYHLTTYKQCFIGKDFVDWLIQKGEASTRAEAVEVGKQLLDTGVFRHVCDDHHFKDEHLFYRFRNDDKGKSSRLIDRVGVKKGSSRKSRGRDDDSSSHGSENRGSGASWDSSGELHTPPPERMATPESDEYLPMHRPSPQASPQPNRAVHVQQPPTDVKTNGAVPPAASSSTSTGGHGRPTIEELTDPNGSYVKRKIDVVSDPVGYGFVIRGSRPVYVHSIDPSGPAAGAGLKVGEYLYSVNSSNVLHASHTEAARIILMGSSVASLVTFVQRDRLNS